MEIDEVLKAMENCLNTPMIINKEETKRRIEAEKRLCDELEKIYRPNQQSLRFKQFTI